MPLQIRLHGGGSTKSGWDAVIKPSLQDLFQSKVHSNVDDVKQADPQAKRQDHRDGEKAKLHQSIDEALAKARPSITAAAAAVDTGTLAGRWELDTARSESLEPFLVSVGAPRLIAKMVGSKGKPVTITVGAATVEVTTDGKPPERLSLKGAAALCGPDGGRLTRRSVLRSAPAVVPSVCTPR